LRGPRERRPPGVDTADVPADASGAAYDAKAWDRGRERIGHARAADGAGRARPTRRRGEPAVPHRVVALDDPLGRIAAHGVASWLHRRDGAGHAARAAVTT
jgi:hypothetical protein